MYVTKGLEEQWVYMTKMAMDECPEHLKNKLHFQLNNTLCLTKISF